MVSLSMCHCSFEVCLDSHLGLLERVRFGAEICRISKYIAKQSFRSAIIADSA